MRTALALLSLAACGHRDDRSLPGVSFAANGGVVAMVPATDHTSAYVVYTTDEGTLRLGELDLLSDAPAIEDAGVDVPTDLDTEPSYAMAVSPETGLVFVRVGDTLYVADDGAVTDVMHVGRGAMAFSSDGERLYVDHSVYPVDGATVSEGTETGVDTGPAPVIWWAADGADMYFSGDGSVAGMVTASGEVRMGFEWMEDSDHEDRWDYFRSFGVRRGADWFDGTALIHDGWGYWAVPMTGARLAGSSLDHARRSRQIDHRSYEPHWQFGWTSPVATAMDPSGERSAILLPNGVLVLSGYAELSEPEAIEGDWCVWDRSPYDSLSPVPSANRLSIREGAVTVGYSDPNWGDLSQEATEVERHGDRIAWHLEGYDGNFGLTLEHRFSVSEGDVLVLAGEVPKHLPDTDAVPWAFGTWLRRIDGVCPIEEP